MRLVRKVEEEVKVEFFVAGTTINAEYRDREGQKVTQTIADITPKGIKMVGWVHEDLPLPRQDGPTSAVRVQ